MNELTNEINGFSFTLFDCLIDKVKFLNKYPVYANRAYLKAIEFMLDRFVIFAEQQNAIISLVLESRGKKEDKELLETIKLILNTGTNRVSSKRLKRIAGVYFNPKRPIEDERKTYFGLEIADLCAYPIYKYLVYGTRDQCFDVLENKIFKYPNYYEYGIKIFP